MAAPLARIEYQIIPIWRQALSTLRISKLARVLVQPSNEHADYKLYITALDLFIKKHSLAVSAPATACQRRVASPKDMRLHVDGAWEEGGTGLGLCGVLRRLWLRRNAPAWQL